MSDRLPSSSPNGESRRSVGREEWKEDQREVLKDHESFAVEGREEEGELEKEEGRKRGVELELELTRFR